MGFFSTIRSSFRKLVDRFKPKPAPTQSPASQTRAIETARQTYSQPQTTQNVIKTARQSFSGLGETRQSSASSPTRTLSSAPTPTGTTAPTEDANILEQAISGIQQFRTEGRARIEGTPLGSLLSGAQQIAEIPGAMGVMGMVSAGGGPTKSLGRAFSNAKAGAVVGKVPKATGAVGNVWNTKTEVIAQNLFKRLLAGKGLKTTSKVAAGLVAAAGSMFLGLWGQAEAGEPLSIVMKDVGRTAQETGDWSLYAEAAEMRDEIVNLPVWQKIALYTPASSFIGIPNKMKGVIAAAKVQDAWAEGEQIRQETGMTDSQFWQNYQDNKFQDEQMLIHLHNQARIETEQEILRLRREAASVASADRLEETRRQIREWESFKRAQRKAEEADRIAQMEFWLEYRKLIIEMQDAQRPSNLKFGLL
jgi:hypothetical protein